MWSLFRRHRAADLHSRRSATTSCTQARTYLLIGLLAALSTSQTAASPTPTNTVSETPFSYNSLYNLLFAEMALQRSQPDVALTAYAQQAKETQDEGITERAMQIANYLQNSTIGLPLAEQWTTISPKTAKAYYQLAYHSLKKQHYDVAIKAIDKLLMLEPEAELEALFLGAYPPHAAGRTELLSALAGLESAYPNNAHLLFAHGLLIAENGDYQGALSYMHKAHLKSPRSVPIILLEARLLNLNKQDKDAVTLLEQALVNNPKSQQLNMHYIRALIATKDYNKAENKLAQLLVALPNNVEALTMHALLAFDNKHDEVAITSFNKLIALESNEDEARYYLALIAKRQGKLAIAENYLAQISEGDRFLSAQAELATLRINDNRVAQARQQFAESRQQQPELANTLYAIEAELLNSHQLSEVAYALLTEGIKKFPEDSVLLFSRALMADKQNNILQFEKDMQELLRRDPDNPSYMNAYGYTLVDKTTRLAEAEPYLQRAIKLKPNDPAIIDSIGWLLYKQGHLFEALTYIKRAFAASADEEIGLHLAEILWMSGYKAEATQIWQQLLSKNPRSEAVLKHRALWEKKA